MPEKMLEKLNKSILPQWKACFLSALVIGLIAHLYKITNWLPNWDSLVFRYDAQNMISIGRWFLPVACGFSSFYDLPFIAGLMAIIFHAIGAVIILKIFDVKKNTTGVLIGALVAAFPTVTSVMMYNYVADGYALAFLLSCLAALYLTKEKPNYILAALLIAFSSGIYQAYITVTITLLLCHLITELIKKDSDIKKLLFKTLKCFITGAAGMVIYYLILTILLKITGTQLLDYQGFDNATSFKGINIPAALYVVKYSFTDYFFDFSKGINAFLIINCIVFVITVAMYISDIIKNKLSIAKIILLCFYAILLPIGANVLAFINSGIDYHNLMKMGFLVFYMFFILHYEKTDFKNTKINVAKLWTILLVASVLVFNNIIIANISYQKLGIAFEKSYSVLVRIADRIEQTDGSENCNKLLVLGALKGSEAYSSNLPPNMTGTTDSFILRADDEIVNQSVLCTALNDYCGKDFEFVSGVEKAELLKKIDVKALDNWPASDSVFVTDNVVVVKLSD